jgi:MATE family multidrug resistance protein
MSTPVRNELRALLRLALPSVVVQLGMMLMSVVDVVMIGHLSGEALGSVALGNVVSWGLIAFGLGSVMAVDPVVSQAVGARDERAIGRALQRGLLLAAALAVPLAALHLLAGPALRLAGQPAALVPAACDYAWALAPGVLPFLWFSVLRQTLQSLSRLRPIVLTIGLANVVNFGLNWLLIWGGPGIPPLGVTGAAVATTLARWTLVLMLFWLAWPLLRPHLRPLRREAFTCRPLLAMLRIGVPIGLQFELEMGVFAYVLLLMGAFGEAAVGGHQIAINLASLSFMVPLGVSFAASVRVGYAVGAGDLAAARLAARSALAVGITVMACFMLLFALAPGILARCYTEDASVLAVAVALLPVAGAFQVFDGVQVVSIGVLRGLSDTRTPVVINVLGFWLLGAPASWLLAHQAGGGPVGLWWGLVLGLVVVALALVLRIVARLRGGLVRFDVESSARLDSAPASGGGHAGGVH